MPNGVRYKCYEDIPDEAELKRVGKLHAAAREKMLDDPGSLTDDEIDGIAILSPLDRKTALQARTEAIAKQRAAVAPQQLSPTATYARRVDLKNTETLEAYFERAPLAATPLILFGQLFKFAGDVNEKNKTAMRGLTRSRAKWQRSSRKSPIGNTKACTKPASSTAHNTVTHQGSTWHANVAHDAQTWRVGRLGVDDKNAVAMAATPRRAHEGGYPGRAAQRCVS
jgi:hypothetical protein